ncbi:putative S-adenosylmethionine-dependent methyltransferase [Aspergillus lucknowensis]|uniref:Protein-lysine N-methyltransferase EFM4 n=1 Tax=Aspergillus lucknowensis TaxID=176173 RepID=A0ABR4LVV2_9EURO
MAGASGECHPTHLSSSELGTKEYWETFYSRTLTHIATKPNSNRSRSPNLARASEGTNENEDDDDDDEEEEDEYNADSDPGTSWFAEHNAPAKVLDFLTGEAFPLAPCRTLKVPASTTTTTTTTTTRRASGSGGLRRERKTARPLNSEERQAQPSILDLGTGNGSMLALLRKRGGFRGEMVGVDYSAKSVELARELQRSRRHEAYLSGSEDEDEDESEGEDDAETEADAEGEGRRDTEEAEEWDEIRFEEWDILSSADDLRSEGLDWFPYEKGGFDIVLDKGTFDAVSLMVEKSECERYPRIAGSLVRKGGFLIVTSCNWTEEEVVQWFTSIPAGGESQAAELVVWGRVQYPRFRFGGQEGQGVCTVCFQRV